MIFALFIPVESRSEAVVNIYAVALNDFATNISAMLSGGDNSCVRAMANKCREVFFTKNDNGYYRAATYGANQEVTMGMWLSQLGTSQEVREFGTRMIQDHSLDYRALLDLGGLEGAEIPTRLRGKYKSQVKALLPFTGLLLDKKYLQFEVKNHTKYIAATQREIKNAKNANVQAYAAAALPVLEAHLALAKSTLAKVTQLCAADSKCSRGRSAGKPPFVCNG